MHVPPFVAPWRGQTAAEPWRLRATVGSGGSVVHSSKIVQATPVESHHAWNDVTISFAVAATRSNAALILDVSTTKSIVRMSPRRQSDATSAHGSGRK